MNRVRQNDVAEDRIDKEMVNVGHAYAPPVGCDAEENERFWSLLGEVVMKIQETERIWIGTDLNWLVEQDQAGIS